MGHAYDDLKANGKKFVVERQENIVFEQNSKNLIKRRQTVVREKSTRTKTPDKSPKEQLTNIEGIIVDGNTAETEVELIKKQNFLDRVQYAYKQLGCLEACFNHEIEKLKQQRSLLRMSFKPSKKKQKKRSEDQYLVNVSKSREEIGVERFSTIHQCVCTSPRYGGIEELSCRPRTRTVSSQIETTPPLDDHGAVGDHLSANKIPEKYSKSQNRFKNNNKSLKELEILLTSPEVTEDTNLFYKKENDQIVNYCYCNSNNNNVVGPNYYNNSVSCNQRNYQESGTTGGYDYNYCRNEYYQLNPCVQSNNQYTNNAQPRFVHCCPRQKPININCGRKRTDIGTEHYFNAKSSASPSSPRTPSPTSKRNGKCRMYENIIKAELEKELQQQLKKTKEKDIKKQCKELREEKEREQDQDKKRTRGQEKRSTKSNERQRSRVEECELRQRLLERLQNESATKLVELLDRYVDEKDEMKSKKHKRRISEKVTTRDDLAKVRSQEKLCEITLRKRRVLQQNLSPEQESSAASWCPEYYVESVECYKQPSTESQYSLETLRMLKKMRITEYKPIKLKTKPKLDKNTKNKQYNEYINKYKREEAEIKSSTPISEKEKLSDLRPDSPDKISNNYGKHVDSGLPKDERFNENLSSEYNTNESKDERSQQTRGMVAANRKEPVNYDEFKKEMDKQLLYTPSPRDTYSSGDKSTRTFTTYDNVKPQTKDEGIQAHFSLEDSPTTNNNYSSISKIKKALLSLKEFLNNYKEICPEEEEKLNELQATATDVISKIVVCKGVTTNTSSTLNTPEKQSKLESENLKQSEKVSEEVQTENNKATEDNLNQSHYVEENFENYSCRGQQQQQYQKQQADEEVYQCGTEYEESNTNRENGINVNSVTDVCSPLLHTTYEKEYYCLPEPIYVNAEVCCDPCIDFKNECKNSYTSQPQLRTPRKQADDIPSVSKESQSKPLKCASPSRPQTFSMSGSVDLCPDSFSHQSCTDYMDCLSSTVIHKRVDAQTTTPRNSNTGSQNTSPSYQYSPGCASPRGTPKDRKSSPNKCTKQENSSPLRGILKPPQLIGCEQRTIEAQTSRSVKDNDSDQRSVSICSSTTQLLYQKNKISDEHKNQDSEESVSCKDRRNQPLRNTCTCRRDISESPPPTKTSNEKVGSEHSQLDLRTNRNKNVSQPSCTCRNDVTIKKQTRQSSRDCTPAFNHCSCMQEIYCNLLELYCKGKEREKRKKGSQYTRR